MYNDERIIINTRNVMIEDIYDKYKLGQIIFFEKSNISYRRKNKIIKEVLEALYRGIPFPPVYVSELQTGELLVLDKSDRLRFLMEFLDCGFDIRSSEEYRELNDKYERYYNKREIFYSQIILYVIDYINPRYMHMQVGAFIEEWTMTQEQSIRKILYRELNESFFKDVLSELKNVRNIDLSLEYQFLYFIMVHLITIKAFSDEKYMEYGNADRFILLENTIYELNHISFGHLNELKNRFEECYDLLNYMCRKDNIVNYAMREYRTNYLCFLEVWRLVVGKDNVEVFYNKNVKRMIENCDMSYVSIKNIIECFRRGEI